MNITSPTGNPDGHRTNSNGERRPAWLSRRTSKRALIGLGLIVPLVLASVASSTGPLLSVAKTPGQSSHALAATTKQVKAALAAAAVPATPTRNLALSVTTSRNSLAANGPTQGTPVATYKWLIQADNTSNPEGGADDLRCHPSSNPMFPDSSPAVFTDPAKTANPNPGTACPWPSMAVMSSSPVISGGNQADWGSMTLPAFDPATGRGIKDGKYLVSVLANGYELGGVHFTVPFAADTPGGTFGTVKVKLNPYPIPLGTVRLRVCSDTTPVSGTCDIDTEKGLPGFSATLSDYDGIVSTDYYGNPLCTQYQTNAQGLFILSEKGKPTPIAGTGGQCLSDAKGDITIPNMAPNHYSARVTPPTGQTWIQTTTLEGNHDFDVWTSANDTGYDTEMAVGGEPVPFIDFGFVPPVGTQPAGANGVGAVDATKTGEIKGQVFGALAYLPGIGGLPGAGNSAGVSGQKLERPVTGAWIALNSLTNNDNIVYGGPANPVDGTFDLKGVPNGDYTIAAWDYNQDYLLDSFNVTVADGKVVDLGILPLNNWWTRVFGKICVDLNGNGRCDPEEPGIPKILVQNLMRGNHSVDGGINTALSDLTGNYELTQGYPLGMYNVQQVFNTRYKTIGITYQSCNDKQEHTVITPAVDISYLASFGQCERIDWALKPYSPVPSAPGVNTDNGGIVATVLYDSIRLTNPARQSLQFDHMVGIPGVQMDLYTPIRDTATPVTSTGATTFTATTATDPTATWATDQWRGYTVSAGRTKATVESNTATTLTFVGQGWPGAKTPVNGAAFTIADNGFVLCTTYNQCAANDMSYAVTDPATGTRVSIDRVQSGSPNQPVPARIGQNPTPDQAYVSEHYAPPVGCVPLDANGHTLGTTTQDVTSVPGQAAWQNGQSRCIESAIAGTATGGGTDNSPICYTNAAGTIVPADVAAPIDDPLHPNPGYQICTSAGKPMLHGIQTVDGNYGLTPAAPGDYMVHLEIPGDKVLPQTTDGAGNPVDRPLFHVTTEADRNDANGMQMVPQGGDFSGLPWPPPAEPANQAPQGYYQENPGTSSPAPDPQCTGPSWTVKTTNEAFLADGGSPFEGLARNLCDTKLIHVGAGQSVAPNFHVWTDVPLATKFSGLILDDASLDNNIKSAGLGDVNPIAGAPIGVYDWAQNLLTTTTSDYNGVWTVLMPSTVIDNCPTPAGVCPSMYRFVGNDPGQPDAPNFNYNPQYRTIAANFQAWPGQIVPADVAPTIQAYSGSIAPGQQFATPAGQVCLPAQTDPQLFSVDTPYYKPAENNPTPGSLKITGVGFGTTQSTGKVTLTGPGALYHSGQSTSYQDGGTHPVDTAAHWASNQWTNATITAGTSQATIVENSGNELTVNSWSNGVPANGTTFTITPPSTTLAVNSWNDTAIGVTIPVNLRGGAYQLGITNASGRTPRNSLTYHVIADDQLTGINYNPHIFEVGPGKTYGTIQTALDAAAKFTKALVVVYPNATGWVTIPSYNSTGRPTYTAAGNVTDLAAQWNINQWAGFAITAGPSVGTVLSNTTNGLTLTAAGWSGGVPATGTAFTIHQVQTPSNFTPLTAYYENIIIHSAVQLQGTGPGGIYPPDPVSGISATVPGSVIDGRYFFSGEVPAGATGTVQTAWDNLIGSLSFGGPTAVPDAAVVTVVGKSGQYKPSFAPGLDGFRIQGGNDNNVSGNQGTLAYQKVPGTYTPLETQGGAVYLHANADNFGITNNLVVGNSGVYGDIRLGAPQGSPAGVPLTSNQPNKNVRIANNSLIANGGTNLAGGIGLFAGSDGYAISENFMCGNHSSEYGGAVSHFGLSPNGKIVNNVIALNESIDEGGGIMIAGENPPAGQKFYTGAGAVEISHNYIAGNLGGDDGGGIRFLSAGAALFTVADNVITNNVSAHEGGGISIDDASNVRIVNDTIAMNITTATAATSNGAPAPTGVSTGMQSALLDAATHCTPVAPAPHCVSQPIMLNDILWDNRAGSWSSGGVLGIGQNGAADVNVWDVGSADGFGPLPAPRYSLIQSTQGYTGDATNIIGVDPLFAAAYVSQVQVTGQRTFFRFRPAAVITISLPANLLGDYSVGAASPAIGSGAAQYTYTNPNRVVIAPTTNVDNQAWPTAGHPNRGAK